MIHYELKINNFLNRFERQRFKTQKDTGGRALFDVNRDQKISLANNKFANKKKKLTIN